MHIHRHAGVETKCMSLLMYMFHEVQKLTNLPSGFSHCAKKRDPYAVYLVNIFPLLYVAGVEMLLYN